jgi:chitodextrinase
LFDSRNSTIDDCNWNLHPFLATGEKYCLRVYGVGYDITYNITFNPQVLISSVPTPAAPTGLSLTGKNQSSVSISWNYSPNATGYYVYQNGMKVTNNPITSTTYTFYGLSGDTEYKFSVSAVNESGESGCSYTLVAATEKIPSAPEAPKGIIASSITDTTVDLSWLSVNGATGYYVYINGYRLTGYPVTSTYYTVNSLSPADSYDFAVTAVNNAGESFNLFKFRDPDTGFISIKSKDGKELKALELPGLWNGAMAFWNTVFVEVPVETFNPVKTINDLLRPQHLG